MTTLSETIGSLRDLPTKLGPVLMLPLTVKACAKTIESQDDIEAIRRAISVLREAAEEAQQALDSEI